MHRRIASRHWRTLRPRSGYLASLNLNPCRWRLATKSNFAF